MSSSEVSFCLSTINKSNENPAEEQIENHVNIRQFLKSYWKILKKEIIELFTFHPKEWLNGFRRNRNYPLFVLGDIDGFVALFVNNLATLLAVILGLKIVFESDIIYGKILPGYSNIISLRSKNKKKILFNLYSVAISMLWGNFYYVYMARKLAYKENRNDVCTMPYGINTPGACNYV